MDAKSKASEQSQSSTGISRATNMAWSDALGQASIESRQYHHAEIDRNGQIASGRCGPGIITSLSGLRGIRGQPFFSIQSPI